MIPGYVWVLQETFFCIPSVHPIAPTSLGIEENIIWSYFTNHTFFEARCIKGKSKKMKKAKMGGHARTRIKRNSITKSRRSKTKTVLKLVHF